MRRFSTRGTRVVAAMLVVAALVPVASADERRSARLRELAFELAQRLGTDRVELLHGEERVEIEPVGSRAEEPPATFDARISSDAVVIAMNRERAKLGLEPLRTDARLTLAAGDRIRDMMTNHYFAHVAPDGAEPFEAIVDRGYDFRSAGENLGVGFTSAEAIVRAWMRSPDHRDNILSPEFEEVGIAICSEAPKPSMRGHLFVALYGAE